MLCLLGPAWLSASRPAAECINVSAEGSGPLSANPFGGAPSPVTLGDIPGLLSSVVTGLETSGANGQGAQHLTLQHTFVSTDPSRQGSFQTEDRAVCGPAGSDPNVCHVNDVLQIVSGTGIFSNADGSCASWKYRSQYLQLRFPSRPSIVTVFKNPPTGFFPARTNFRRFNESNSAVQRSVFASSEHDPTRYDERKLSRQTAGTNSCRSASRTALV